MQHIDLAKYKIKSIAGQNVNIADAREDMDKKLAVCKKEGYTIILDIQWNSCVRSAYLYHIYYALVGKPINKEL